MLWYVLHGSGVVGKRHTPRYNRLQDPGASGADTRTGAFEHG